MRDRRVIAFELLLVGSVVGVRNGTILPEFSLPWLGIHFGELHMPPLYDDAHCPAVLIAPDWALASASCHVDRVMGDPTVVHFRRHNVRAGPLIEPKIERTWTEHIHPLGHVKLLRLDRAVNNPDHDTGEEISYAKLDFGDSVAQYGDQATVVGWGAIQSGTFRTANRPWQYTYPVLPERECGLLSVEHEYMMCAGTEGLPNACLGDDGAPLIHQESGTVVGLYSLAPGLMYNNACPGSLTQGGPPDAYFRVNYYEEWIRGHIGDFQDTL